jgi:molybdenum cofactor sulfurtransferase
MLWYVYSAKIISTLPYEMHSQSILSRHHHSEQSPSLFAMTGQSNVSNAKNPLMLVSHAASMGYHTLLDAAALAPTSLISLTDTPVDAMAISFYKMFGFPTGVGALIAKKSFLGKLQRPWFAGGTVDVVQAPGTIFTLSHELHEQFEVGNDHPHESDQH